LVAKKREIKAVMSNSFGFGGTNSSLVLKKYKA
jgi:3-oxoacyl-[acyl-carrier-protein] synthase II